MGVYTGLRCKIIVKEEFRKEVSKAIQSRSWEISQHEELVSFSQLPRSDRLFVGVVEGMPFCWEKRFGVPTDGFDGRYYEKTGFWTFQCSLKSEDNEVNYFVEKLLPLIADKFIHVEVMHELCRSSGMYQLSCSGNVCSNEGVFYEETDLDQFESWELSSDNLLIENVPNSYSNFSFCDDTTYRQGVFVVIE